MKRFLLAGATLLALATAQPTLAADAPVYKGPAPAAIAVFNWSGFYIGGHAGWAWANSDWTFQNTNFFGPVGRQAGFRTDGGLAGAQVGFNYQTGNFLVGIEGTWSYSRLDRTIVSPVFALTDQWRTEIKSLYTVAARLGAIWDRSLWYVKGGWAGGCVNLSATSTFGGATLWNPGCDRSGWVIGAGIEYMLAPNWIFGLEYNYIDLGSKTYTANNTGASTSLTSINDSTKLQTVIARLSYLFATR